MIGYNSRMFLAGRWHACESTVALVLRPPLLALALRTRAKSLNYLRASLISG